MRRSIMIVVGLGMILGLASAPSWAGDGEAAAPTTGPAAGGEVSASALAQVDRAEIERLAANLGSSSRLVRESAEKRLVEIGPPAVWVLRAAAESGNEQVRSRGAAVLLAIGQARESCVKELGKVPQPFKDTHPYISPDGEHYAYILRPGGKEIIVYDGNQGPPWDSLAYIGPFSADGKHFPYVAKAGESSFIVFAGENRDPIPIVSPNRVVYSADCSRFAYWVRQGAEEWIVCDGKAGPRYKRIGEYHFSPNGKRFAYAARDANGAAFLVVDGEALGPFERVGAGVFSPDGKRLAYTVRRLGKEYLICDGKQWPAYDQVFYPMFSPDSNSLACWARTADYKQHFVIRDGKQILQFSSEPRLAFSPDGKVLACSTYNGSELYRLDEKVELLAAGYDAASAPVFSPESRHIACAVGKERRWWVCVDGKDLAGTYDAESVLHWDGVAGGGSRMILAPPGFSADGRHVYFKGFRGPEGNLGPGKREHFIVCDGVEGPSHDGLWIPSGLANGAKRLRYVVRDGDRLRLMEFAWPETTTWQDAVERELTDGKAGKPLHLTPGRHVVRVSYAEIVPVGSSNAGIQCQTNPVEVVIEAEPAAAESAATAAATQPAGTGKASPQWSWQAPADVPPKGQTWRQAFDAATTYALGEPTRKQALRLYQRVLDAGPPRQIELHVRLIMSARLSVLYNPALGEQSLEEEALKWTEGILKDFSDFSTHHDLMVAKIHVANLLGMADKPDRQRALKLLWEVVEVPEGDIVFDDPSYTKLNMDKIAVAKAQVGRRTGPDGKLLTEPTEEMNMEFRNQLLSRRRTETNRLRATAIRALVDNTPGSILERVSALQRLRQSDELYQDTLDEIVKRLYKAKAPSPGKAGPTR